MKPFSTFDPTSTVAKLVAGAVAGPEHAQSHLDQAVEQKNGNLGPPNSVFTRREPSVRFPAEDGGRSLAEMAQRDLDAALQLLADRAQYITGASGVAIALRRDGVNDMLCRASSGSNAPELGALLSTEFGLSGESVRTCQALRCDDAERDPRVNRDVCRQLGIASVVVMPVVNDEGVLGVFELFSGKANAFGDRDVSAVQRLGEMVETAVRLAQATEELPERLRMQETSSPKFAEAGPPEDQVLDSHLLDEEVLARLESQVLALNDQVLEDSILEEPVVGTVAETVAPKPAPAASTTQADTQQKSANVVPASPLLSAPDLADSGAPEPPKVSVIEPIPAESQVVPLQGERTAISPTDTAAPETPPVVAKTVAPNDVVPQVKPVPDPSTEIAAPNKPLFWSAALNGTGDSGKSENADQSHVPPVLRGLRKCEACGFPVSAGRLLCVECEEKKWRGQIKKPQTVTPQGTASAVPLPEKPGLPTAAADSITERTGSLAGLQHQKAGASIPPIAPPTRSTADAASSTGVPQAAAAPLNPQIRPQMTDAGPHIVASLSDAFVLSAGLAPQQSWLSANKYIIGVILLVAAVAAVVFLMR